jgi:hypothetical protein
MGGVMPRELDRFFEFLPVYLVFFVLFFFGAVGWHFVKEVASNFDKIMHPVVHKMTEAELLSQRFYAHNHVINGKRVWVDVHNLRQPDTNVVITATYGLTPRHAR